MWPRSIEQKLDQAHNNLEEARRQKWLAETCVAEGKPGAAQFLRDATANVAHRHDELCKVQAKRDK